MRIRSQAVSLQSLKTDLLVVVAAPKEVKSKSEKAGRGAIGFNQIDLEYFGAIRKKARREEFEGKTNQSMYFDGDTELGTQGVLIVGWDANNKDRFELLELVRKLATKIYGCCKSHKLKRVVVSGSDVGWSDKDILAAFCEGIGLSEYSYDRYKKSKSKTKTISDLTFGRAAKISSETIRASKAMVEGTALARDLVNTPARDCTPRSLVNTARKIGRDSSIKVQVYDRKRLEQLKAGSLLSVSDGSDQPPYLIKMTHKPRGKVRKVISIVGKGVTFDSGGYSLKPPSGMETMKCDMSGAAAVLGAMHAVGALKPGVEVRAYVPTCENMVNGKATRPGDVVRAMNGKTIEILNTDAEGRLILADALTLATKEGADVIIDLATLTGACVVALGDDYSGLFSTSKKLAEKLLLAAEGAGERFWEMPLAPEYRKLLDSKIADLKNVGGRAGGAITAALFLKEFVGEKQDWAHLDIAGPAFRSGARDYLSAGGVGFGVRTLVRYILNQ